MRLLCLCVHRNMNVIIPPHPTPPTPPTPRVTDHERAVRVSALQQERWWGCCACAGIGTWTLLTHPTPPVTDHERAVPVSSQQQERWWGCCACVCIGTWTLSSHPTPPHPPHPTGNWSWKSSACKCSTARKMMRLLCVCRHRNMNLINSPHPTGNWSWKSCACLCSTGRKMMRLLCLCVHRNMNVIIPPHPTPPTPHNQTRNGWFPASMCADDRSLCADDAVSLCADDSFAMCADDSLSMCADDALTLQFYFSLTFLSWLLNGKLVWVRFWACGVPRIIVFALIRVITAIFLKAPAYLHRWVTMEQWVIFGGWQQSNSSIVWHQRTPWAHQNLQFCTFWWLFSIYHIRQTARNVSVQCMVTNKYANYLFVFALFPKFDLSHAFTVAHFRCSCHGGNFHCRRIPWMLRRMMRNCRRLELAFFWPVNSSDWTVPVTSR